MLTDVRDSGQRVLPYRQTRRPRAGRRNRPRTQALGGPPKPPPERRRRTNGPVGSGGAEARHSRRQRRPPRWAEPCGIRTARRAGTPRPARGRGPCRPRCSRPRNGRPRTLHSPSSSDPGHSRFYRKRLSFSNSIASDRAGPGHDGQITPCRLGTRGHHAPDRTGGRPAQLPPASRPAPGAGRRPPVHDGGGSPGSAATRTRLRARRPRAPVRLDAVGRSPRVRTRSRTARPGGGPGSAPASRTARCCCPGW